ncbi:MAG TPA: hypothetical protein VKA50_12490 [Gammaproteobacteria bacterium]|nr:hypothetical protein [Gammaproteobacteria bacterium]
MNEEQIEALMRGVRQHIPELEDLMRELYNKRMIPGSSALLSLTVDGRTYGFTLGGNSVTPARVTHCQKCGEPFALSGPAHQCEEKTEKR